MDIRRAYSKLGGTKAGATGQVYRTAAPDSP